MPTSTAPTFIAAIATTAFALALVPTTAFAGQPAEDGAELDAATRSEFDKLLAKASAQFDDGDFDGAIASFEAAYEIRADASLLYNIGRVYEEKGDLEPAIDYYGQFARQPGISLELREQAVERVKVLKDIVDATKQDEPPAPAPAPLPEPEPEPEPQPTDTAPGEDGRGLRIAGYSLLGVGGAVVIGGAVAGGLASRDANDLDGEIDPGNRRDLKDAGENKALAADVMFIAGGTLALTGVALIVAGVVKKRRTERNLAIAPVVSPRFAGTHLSFSF